MFDLDLLEGRRLIIRKARPGETLKTLDGVERKLTPDDLVVADAVKPVGLAGVMGGFDTMITEKTRNILIESAWWDPVTVRRMSKRHGIHTDASHRFERGADFESTVPSTNRVAELILDSGGGTLIGDVIDEVARKLDLAPVELDLREVHRILGEKLSTLEISRQIESASVGAVYRDRRMPYTVGLLGSAPRLDAPQGSRLVPIPGAPPSLSALQPGCPFGPRCPLVIDACRAEEPELVLVAPDHHAACIRTELVVGRSAADIYGVSTEPEPVEPGEPSVVVRVRDLVRTFPLTKGVLFRRNIGEVRAVDGISFELRQGRTLAIVGESGSGKSTTLHEILELVPPQSGSIDVLGADVATLTPASRRALRRDIQVVFQDPAASLDPRLPVFELLSEPLHANGFSKADTSGRVAELLDTVGLARADASRYPAEFSGGQKQRIGIARALALQPKILALDEPVSALDVSIQAGILNLLLDLQQEFGLSYLFISHNLSVVKHLAHQVAVMHRGVIVEQGDSDEIFNRPQHEYTRRLLAAVPQPDSARG